MKNLLILILLLATSVFSQTDSLVITWNPNPESDMASYRLFRSRNNAGFTLLQTILHPTTRTVDRLSVAPGGLYEFYLQAVDDANNVSENSDVATAGIPIIIWSVTTIKSGGDTTILDANYLLDPDDSITNLMIDIYNQLNVLVEKTSGGLRLTPVPMDYVGIASFDMVAQDQPGFHDDRHISVEFIQGEAVIGTTKEIKIDLSP